jgi:glutamate mutase epsilon subunit
MVTNIVESRAVYAELITNDSSSDENGQTYEKTDSGKDKDITIVFKHKLAFPENKKKLFSIIILTGLLALLIFTYVQLAPLFFNR